MTITTAYPVADSDAEAAPTRTVKQVAAEQRVSVNTVRRAIKAGHLAVVWDAGCFRIDAAEAAEWGDERRLRRAGKNPTRLLRGETREEFIRVMLHARESYDPELMRRVIGFEEPDD